MKEVSKGKNQIVYKCNSRHCKANGYHTKEDSRVITLKLTLGKDCPLDFEEQIVQTVTKMVEGSPSPTSSYGAGGGVVIPTQQQTPQQKRRSAIPAGLVQQGLQMKPPPGAV